MYRLHEFYIIVKQIQDVSEIGFLTEIILHKKII